MKVATPWPSWRCPLRAEPGQTVCLLPRESPRQPPGGGPINSWSQLSRPPLARAASTHIVFRLCRKQRQCGERRAGKSSQVQWFYWAHEGRPETAHQLHRHHAPLGTWEELSQCLEIGARRHLQKAVFGLENYTSVWSLGTPGLSSAKLTERPFMKLSGDISKREK